MRAFLKNSIFYDKTVTLVNHKILLNVKELFSSLLYIYSNSI